MYTCANCEILACIKGDFEKAPDNCPMKEKEIYKNVKEEYEKKEINDFIDSTIEIEKKGNNQWSRLEETIKFCQTMEYKKIGVAFCLGLRKEARTLVKIFKEHDFEVSSVNCKNGGIEKNELTISDGEKGVSCNPIGQAMLLNKEETDFNIALGLCVGHDALFFKYAQAPTTVLVTKDRVLAHNPVGALYCSHSYYYKKLKNK